MPDPQTLSSQQHALAASLDVARARRYLPPGLWERWQAGDPSGILDHLRAVLHTTISYLPRWVVRRCWANPTGPAVAATFTPATLMFADISGFTAMSERLTELGLRGAEIITNIVNDYFATMLEIIYRYGGDLFKFGGDALLVCFNGADAAARACHAAMAMQQAMARFDVIEVEQDTFSLRMKIGLGTGSLLLASLGTPDRLEFAVMGPALGRMARAESMARAEQVLMDQATQTAAAAAIQAAPCDSGFFRLEATAVSLPPASLWTPPDLDDVNHLLDRLDVLTSYISPRILERIISAPGQQLSEGEHRPATVLFANFYGIDEIIAALGADRAAEIVALLNQHFTTMQAIIRQYGGIVNKVDTYAVGYRIMAVFGAPFAHEDDPLRAVHAALDMQKAMSAFADLSTSAGRFALKQRIGINTGYVFAGSVGSALRQEYSVMGDNVNLAARLMGIADEGQVIISQATAHHVTGMFKWQARPPVHVKGKAEPVVNYCVLAPVEQRGVRPGVRSVLVGRQAELRTIQRLIEAACQGRGALLDLSGSRGIGKSRLLEEASAYAHLRDMLVLRGAALSYGHGIPYLPWLDIFNTLFGLQDVPPDQRAESLVQTLEAAGLGMWAPIVGSVLGVKIAETPLTASLDARLRQQRFFDLVRQMLRRRAARTPLLLILDDVQWADDVSLDLITYVAHNLADMPLLLAVSHWPDMPAPWQESAACHIMALQELDESASLNLARWVVGKGDLAPLVRRLVLDRAQGNPLYVEEITRTLRDSGAIYLEQETLLWQLTSTTGLEQVPTSLAGLIIGRLDRLPSTDRRLLQVASVIGVTFQPDVLTRVYPYEDLPDDLHTCLDRLVAQGLINYVPPDRYTFRQTLTQEVAYGSLSFARRSDLHLRVGRDIERHYSGDLAEQYSLLARHFDQGGDLHKAFTYLVKAGDKARAEYANAAALDDYGRALEIATELDLEEQALDLLEATGDIHLLTSRYDQAIAHFERAAAHPVCSPRRRGDLLRKMAKAYELQGNYQQALAYLKRGRQVLSESEADLRSIEMASVCDLSGWVHMRLGEMERAVAECEQGLEILERLEPTEAVLRNKADVYNTLGAIYGGQGKYRLAAQAYQHSMELREKANDFPGMASCYNNLAMTSWAQGNLSDARAFLERSLEVSRKIGNDYAVAFGHNNLGVVAYTIGDVEGALRHYHTALSLRQRIPDYYGVAQTSHNIGEVYLSLGQHDQARQYLTQAAEIFERIQSEAELPEVYSLLAELELVRDDVTAALDYAGRAQRIAQATDSLELQGIAERVLARCRVRAGQLDQAIQAFEESVRLLEASGHQIELARTHYEYGLLLGQEGKASAREHLEKATRLFTEAGAEKEAAQADAALQGLEVM